MTLMRDFAVGLGPHWFWHGRKGGIVNWLALAVVSEVIADTLLRAAMQGMLMSPLSGDSAAPMSGRQRNMERYPSETIPVYRARLHNAWDYWEFAGGETVLTMLQAAGYGATPIGSEFAEVVPNSADPVISGWYSEFQIILPMPEDSRAIMDCICSDTLMCSDDTMCGTALTTSECMLVANIIRKFRPSKDLCRKVIFVCSAALLPPITIVPWWCPRY